MAKTYDSNGPFAGQNQNTVWLTEEIGSIDIGSSGAADLHVGEWQGAKRLNIQFENLTDDSIRIGYYHTGDFNASSTHAASEWYLEPDGSTTYVVLTGTTHRQVIAGPKEKWKIRQMNGSVGSVSTGSCSIFATYEW